MSLDVYLTLKGQSVIRSDQIYIRENGQNVPVSPEEWAIRSLNRQPTVIRGYVDDSGEVYSANITHNLTTMAKVADLYYPLWRPNEIRIQFARQLIPYLENGLNLLLSDPRGFKKFNPPSGWGSYELLVQFTENYLAAARRYPKSEVSVSR